LLVSILLLVSACVKEVSVLTRRNRKVASTEVVRRLLKKQHKVATSTDSSRQLVMALSESIPKRRLLQAKLKKVRM